MKKRTKRKLIDIVPYLLLFVIIVSSIASVAYLGKIMFSSYTDFSITYNDKVYKGDEKGLVLPFGKDIVFDVSYSYHKLTIDKDYSYSVEVLPVGEFLFTVDGKEHKFSEEKLTTVFNLKMQTNKFTINIPGAMEDVLGSVYKNSEIVLPELEVDFDYYKIVVTAHDALSNVSFSFKNYSVVTSVVLNYSSLLIDDNGFVVNN